jgi:dihydrofolate reductase
MAKLIQWNVISLDGYFQGPKDWALDWHQTVLDDEFQAFALKQLAEAEGLLFGRKTYEGMAAYWQIATGDIAAYMNTLRKYVFSNSITHADWQNTQLVTGDPVPAVELIKRSAERDLYVFGSGTLSARLLQAGLFDELRIAVAPVVIGSGSTLFGRDLPRVGMKLLEAKPLSNGCVILRYEPRESA